MRRLLLTAFFIAIGALVISVPAGAANSTVTNHDVIEMVHLGLSQQVILTKIQSSPTAFDTSPKALSRLKHAGVPSTIITAMVEGGGEPTAAAAPDAGAAPGNAVFRFIAAGGSRQTMSPVRVTAQMSARKAWIPFYYGGPETFLFIDGRDAQLHTSATPTFVTNLNPINVRLVHLGEKKGRDARYVVFSGSTTDREIQVDTTESGNGMWQIKPRQPLQPGGEYAFLVWTNMPMGCSFWACFAQYSDTSEAFDFGVQ